jgi:hypothetical protein
MGSDEVLMERDLRPWKHITERSRISLDGSSGHRIPLA